jgi:hypothetical protein
MSDTFSPTTGVTNATSTTAPWNVAAPYLEQAFPEIVGAYGDQGRNQIEQQGLNSIYDRANMGNPLIPQSQEALSGFLTGNLAAGNPYLDATYDRAFGQGMKGINSQFSGAGRYGSGAHGIATADLGAKLGENIYGGAYNTDMANRMRAIQMAPGAANADYTDLNQMYGVGQKQYQTDQRGLNQYLTRLSGLGGLGSSGTSQQPYSGPSNADTIGKYLGYL